MVTTRELTPAETNALDFLRDYEKMCENRRISSTYHMTTEALNALKRSNICKPLRVSFDKNRNLHRVVFLVSDLGKYVDFCCKQVGFEVQIDGSIKTYDKMTIEAADIH